MYTTLAILQAIPAAGTIYGTKAWNLYKACEEISDKCMPGYYQMGRMMAKVPEVRNLVLFAGVFFVCLWLQLFALVYHYSHDKFATPPVYATHIGAIGAVAILMCFVLMQNLLRTHGSNENIWKQTTTRQLLAGYVAPNLAFVYLHYKRESVASKVPALREYGIV